MVVGQVHTSWRPLLGLAFRQGPQPGLPSGIQPAFGPVLQSLLRPKRAPTIVPPQDFRPDSVYEAMTGTKLPIYFSTIE